ncbi:hypothetical protein [Pontibacter indicus]|uniref:SpoIIAA-like n=1 Tax=Pontibacter indicus TaxID=1317125 RepID=A0A1R3XDC7_9BACT|nr:hypothetical protein [Pontibacter indicus]SIT89331.1 hypothetical protein SAMN05444128_2000 [Pontibacter indicus]
MDSKAPHNDPSAAARQHVARNSCYEISYDSVRNRLYFNILGYWKNNDSVPEYLKDWDKALQLVSPGFTLLIDMRTMITHPQQLNTLHEQSQRKMRAAGLGSIANVMPTDRIASLQVADIIKRVDVPVQDFVTCEEAQHWLDKTMV